MLLDAEKGQSGFGVRSLAGHNLFHHGTFIVHGTSAWAEF